MLSIDAALAAEYPNFYYPLTDYGLDDEGKTRRTLAEGR